MTPHPEKPNYLRNRAINAQEDLAKQRALMVSYLVLRQGMGDWHGVMDASADIREIDAKLSLLAHLLEGT